MTDQALITVARMHTTDMPELLGEGWANLQNLTNIKAVDAVVVSFESDQHPKKIALSGWGWVGTAVLLLTATVVSAEAGQSKGPRTFIPEIANIAGIKVGYSSMAELERQLGKGRVTIGGHPNGARLWRVKGTSWVLYADAFEYSERGAVVDGFQIRGDGKPGDSLGATTVEPSAGQDVPFARLTRHELAWAGGISLGIDEETLLKLLKQKSWTPVKLADGWRVEARGHSPLTSSPLYPYHQWLATFTMKGKSLVGISVNVMQERTGPTPPAS